MKTLFLRWVLPTSLAENTPHSASNPISESSPSTTDMNRLAKSPVTFSIKKIPDGWYLANNSAGFKEES